LDEQTAKFYLEITVDLRCNKDSRNFVNQLIKQQRTMERRLLRQLRFN